MKRKQPDTHYVVVDKCACMPGSCKGRYRRLGVLEVLSTMTGDDVTMISARSRGVIRVVETWERLHQGQYTGAYYDALAEAEALADDLNHIYDGTDPDDWQRYVEPSLPSGWSVTVWSDGRALVCPPGRYPDDVGGREASLPTRYAAVKDTLVRLLAEALPLAP